MDALRSKFLNSRAMVSKNLPSYFIRPTLSEKQIESDVSTFMGWSATGMPFRLKDISEPMTGSDKLFDQGSMIYMQFKKSMGLQPAKRIPVSKSKFRSSMEDIREYRNNLELDDDPTLFFRLHKKAETAEDFQHNILLSYECPNWSRAIYVAPLTLDKGRYEKILFDSTCRYLEDPFYYELSKTIYHGSWRSVIGATPYLRAHVCITPHERVATHEHYFAYSENGTDISWHSPSFISAGPSRLSDFYARTLADSLLNADHSRPIEELAHSTLEIGKEAELIVDPRGLDSLQQLSVHAKLLYRKYEIKSFILLSRSEQLKNIRERL